MSTPAQELANETGKPWLQSPDWAGGSAQPLEHWKNFSGETPSAERLHRKGFTIVCPEGTTVKDLIRRNELTD